MVPTYSPVAAELHSATYICNRCGGGKTLRLNGTTSVRHGGGVVACNQVVELDTRGAPLASGGHFAHLRADGWTQRQWDAARSVRAQARDQQWYVGLCRTEEHDLTRCC